MMRHPAFAAVIAAVGLLAGSATAQRGSNSYVVVLKEEPLALQVQSRKALERNEASAQRQAILNHQATLAGNFTSLGVRVFDSSQVLLNALYVEASPEQAAALRSNPDVASVEPLRPLRRRINRALDLTNVPAAWNQVGGSSGAGDGVKIAILDTGIDQNHPAFRNFTSNPPAGYPKCRTDNGDCNFTNNKVIAARSYVDLLNFAFGTSPSNTRPDDNTPRDRIGHGTATAMVAAGQSHDSPNGRISGVAPRAYLGNYKVFGTRGVNDTTFANVVIKALEEAISDGMDIASLNLGQPAGWGPLDNVCTINGNRNQPCDAFATAVHNAVTLGLIVTASAGNSGDIGANFPALNTVESPATAPNAIAVGATTNSHIWYNSLTVLGNGVPTDLQALNMRFTDGPQIGTNLDAPITDVGTIVSSNTACDALPDNSLAGRIALIRRGDCTLVQKVNNVQRAGAIAAIFTNYEGGSVFQITGMDNTGIPSGLIGFNAGNALRSFLSNQQRTARLNPAFREVNAPSGQIADFSSRGPSIGNFSVKPDLVAVGTDLYMATQSVDPGGTMYNPNGYTVSDGTSFSAPMVAGAAALIKQKNPSLRPLQVKSLLVSTGNTNLTEFDASNREIAAKVTSMGGGQLDANRALTANITTEPSSIGFGVIPSGGVPARGLIITNVSNNALNLTVRIEQRTSSSSLTITPTPANFSLLSGRDTQINLNVGGTRPATGRYDGFIVISGGSTDVRVPYTYFVGPGPVHNIYSLGGSFAEAIPGSEIPMFLKAVDEFGIPVNGVVGTWSVVSGGGTILDPLNNTDSYGIAEARYRTGNAIGEQVVRYTAGNSFTEFVVNVIPRPAVTVNGVRDAASGEASTAFTAGQYISIYGSALSPTLKAFAGNELPLSLSRVSVSFDNEAQRVSVAGRLHFVSDGQINVQIPWEVAGLATVDMKVSIGEYSSQVVTLRLRAANPAPFEYTEPGSNRRYVAALDGNFNLISSGNPARRGGVVQLYVNGMGAVDRTPGTGQISPSDPLARTNATPVVTIGGRTAPLLFSGLAPGIVGLYQVNVTVPQDAPTGNEIEVSIQQSGVTARTSRIAVQ